MKKIISFLRDLQQNNTREWFHANKVRYDEVKKIWETFCLELINEIGKFDASVTNLTLKDCTYRINRDTRFSNDKSPYKTHMGVFISPGGKKSMHSGYYLHIGTGDEGGYPFTHMLATGNYCYDKAAVKILREDISAGWDEFERDVLNVFDKRFVVSMDGALKRVPAPFAADAPYADWMRMKAYCLDMPVDDDFICAPNLAKRAAAIFKTSKPFSDYINRAVDFAREEMKG